MVTEGPAEVLHDRRDERAALERLLEAVRSGQSRVLVVSGEPGVGKTALLQSAICSASGFRITRTVGVESDQSSWRGFATRGDVKSGLRCTTGARRPVTMRGAVR